MPTSERNNNCKQCENPEGERNKKFGARYFILDLIRFSTQPKYTHTHTHTPQPQPQPAMPFKRITREMDDFIVNDDEVVVRPKNRHELQSEIIQSGWKFAFENGTLQPSLDEFNARALAKGGPIRTIQHTPYESLEPPLVMMNCFRCGVPSPVLPPYYTKNGSKFNPLRPGCQPFHNSRSKGCKKCGKKGLKKFPTLLQQSRSKVEQKDADLYRFCPHCGKDFKEGHNFCGCCGIKRGE